MGRKSTYDLLTGLRVGGGGWGGGWGGGGWGGWKNPEPPGRDHLTLPSLGPRDDSLDSSSWRPYMTRLFRERYNNQVSGAWGLGFRV